MRLTPTSYHAHSQQTIEALAAYSPEKVIFMGRNEKNAEGIISRLTAKHSGLSIRFIACDMTSFASLQKAAQDFIADNSRLDVFVCNAGIMCSDAAVTVDGYQREFQTNHISHALLIKKLLPLMQSTAAADNSDVRIINITSKAYGVAPAGGIDFDTLRTSQEKLSARLGARWGRYGENKTCQHFICGCSGQAIPRTCKHICASGLYLHQPVEKPTNGSEIGRAS